MACKGDRRSIWRSGGKLTYEKIKKFYGTLDDYPQDYKLFAADDDGVLPVK